MWKSRSSKKRFAWGNSTRSIIRTTDIGRAGRTAWSQAAERWRTTTMHTASRLHCTRTLVPRRLDSLHIPCSQITRPPCSHQDTALTSMVTQASTFQRQATVRRVTCRLFPCVRRTSRPGTGTYHPRHRRITSSHLAFLSRAKILFGELSILEAYPNREKSWQARELRVWPGIIQVGRILLWRLNCNMRKKLFGFCSKYTRNDFFKWL